MRTRGPRMGPLEGIAARMLLLALAVLPAVPALAQTIRPVIVEYEKGRAQGRFELVNDGFTPLNVVLEPKSFDITEAGDPVYRPLDSRIHLRLSTMSIRIPAKQTRFVFYEATAESLPAWFVIPCTFSGLPPRAGVEVRVELPHTVYLVQKDRLERGDIEVVTATLNAERHVVEVDIENHGPRLGRAIEAEAIGDGKREHHPSFPMPPLARRRLLIPWSSDESPSRVVVRFHGFAVERALPEPPRAGG